MTSPAAAAVSATGPTRAFPPVPPGPPPDVELVSLYTLDGGAATDSESGVNGTVIGTWTQGDSLVQGVSGQSLFKAISSARITLPADQAAHNLTELSLGFKFQAIASSQKHVMAAASGLSGAVAPGDYSIERLPDGRLRAWHVGQDGALRHFGSGTDQGIDGTNLAVGTAGRLTLVLGPNGAKLYLNDNLVGSIPQNTNGWNNARVKFFGTWVDGAIGSIEGGIDHIRIWSGELQASGVAALEAAVSVTPPNIPTTTNLPFFGRYYGADAFGSKAANTHMIGTVNFFFYAERSGSIDRIFHQPRKGTGYSAGNGGTYTIEIVEASVSTKRPVSGGTVYSRRTGWTPPASTTNTAWQTDTLTPLVAVAAQAPCCLRYTQTAGGSTNFFSTNISIHHGWSGSPSSQSNEPADYQEPAGTDPASLGSSPTTVQGWIPMLMPNGARMYPWPTKCYGNTGTQFQYNRLGPEHAALRYTDGQWTGPAGHAGGGTENGLKLFLNSTSTQFRERFRVSRASRVVDGVFIRLARTGGTTGNLTVRLEQGPQVDTHDADNGTLVESVTVPHTAIYNAGAQICEREHDCGVNTTFTPYIWVPFTQNRTLTLGTIYNLRIQTDASLDVEIVCSDRPDGQGLTPLGRTVGTWDEWEATRTLPWGAFEDSRGLQFSTDGGATWNYQTGPDRIIAPVTFRCVT